MSNSKDFLKPDSIHKWSLSLHGIFEGSFPKPGWSGVVVFMHSIQQCHRLLVVFWWCFHYFTPAQCFFLAGIGRFECSNQIHIMREYLWKKKLDPKTWSWHHGLLQPYFLSDWYVWNKFLFHWFHLLNPTHCPINTFNHSYIQNIQPLNPPTNHQQMDHPQESPNGKDLNWKPQNGCSNKHRAWWWFLTPL